MTAPIRSALIRRPKSSLPLPIASWHCRTPSSCPQSSWTQCCALVRAMRARARLWRTRCNSVLCSAAKAKRPAEPDLSIALQWLLAVTLRYESALALGLGLVPRTKRDSELSCAPRPRGVCPCGARVSQGRVPPRPPTAIGAWWIVWSEPRPEVLGPAGSRKLPQGKTRPFLIASFHRFRAVTPYSRPPLP